MARKVEASSGPKARRTKNSESRPVSSSGTAARPRVRRKAPEPLEPTPSAAEEALALEAFNRRYYDAFQSLSGDEMAKLWWHDEQASCIHPGWDIRTGWSNVRAAYEDIFESTKSIRFALGDVRVRVLGDLAYVTCVENLLSEEDDSSDYLGAVLATNVYERRHGEWKMIHHHASPVATDDADLPEGPLH